MLWSTSFHQLHKQPLRIRKHIYKDYYDSVPEDQKRQMVIDLYVNLVEVVMSFPEETPADILSRVGKTPQDVGFVKKNFQQPLSELKNTINEKQEKLLTIGTDYSRKAILKEEISNLNHVKESLETCRDEYYAAEEKLQSFMMDDAGKFFLLAERKTQDTFLDFFVVRASIYMSGLKISGETFCTVRDDLINALRDDLKK